MPSNIEIIENNSGQFIYLNNESCEARISLLGGQVIHWQPHDQHPVLWLSEKYDDGGSSAIRGGIPICWPWFGPVEQKGRHGLARTANWTLVDTKEESDVTVVKMVCDIGEEVAANWAYPQFLEQTVILGRSLDQTCTVKNTHSRSITFSYALHNYFNIGHIDNISVSGLLNKAYHDKITNKFVEHGDAEEPEYTGPIDRIYRSDEPAVITDPHLGRRISLEKRHGNEWVLWNPGKTAKKIKDIHENGEKTFVCVEAAHTQDVHLEAHASMTFGQKITVRPL